MAEITKIEKLSGKNFQSWKYNIKLVLMERGLWGFTQEGQEIAPGKDASAAVRNAYRLRSDKAYSLIALNVERDIQIHISSTTDPLVAWETLKKQFEFVSITQIVRLNRRFYAATMEEDADLIQHLTHMTSLAEQLRELNEEISSKKFATTVLGSLPDSYDTFLTSLNARNAEDLDWDNVKGLLIEEHMKRKEKLEKQETNNALFVKKGKQSNYPQSRGGRRGGQGQYHNTGNNNNNQKAAQNYNHNERMKGVQCYRCKLFGHVAKNCHYNKPQKGTSGESSNMAEVGGIALISTNDLNRSNEWYIDSAATKHMTFNRAMLTNYFEYKQPRNIFLGDNTVIKALGQREVSLPTTIGLHDFNLDLQKVLYVPSLTKNLLSVPAMVEMEAEFFFDDEKCCVVKNGEKFIIGTLANKLYTVNLKESAQVASISHALPLSVWHRRLGHLNNSYVEQLSKKDMVDGMVHEASVYPEKDCEACILGKMQRKSLPKQSEHRATRPYEVIHTDVCGPMQVKSKGGSEYLLTFTDDYSRYATVFFLKSKSEVLSKFVEYLNGVENQTHHKIKKLNILDNATQVKMIRSDNGGEYTSRDFAKYCADKGILHEFTTPYTPEQNGVAERLNRTIMEAARSMLYQAKLSLQFWAEACSTAVYLHNRSPTSAIKDQTPFERLLGIKPDISNLRVFGCVAYMHVPNSQRKKLDAKARRTIFIGYPPGVKGYKLYDLEKGAFFISGNVKFFEDQFNESRGESESYQFLPASSILPEADEEAEIIPQVPIDAENAEPVGEPQVPIDAGNAEPVGEPQVPLRRQTFEDAFMEQVSQLGPVRQRRPPARYGEECLLMDSLTTEIDEPNSVEEALHGKHSVQWKEAMQSEYSSLLKNETWELVPPPERTNVVGSRWVLKVKRGEDGSVDRFKARLVAQGFSQTKGVDYDEVFSPVVRQTSVRTLLALANAQDYEVHQMDVKTAFLNGVLDCDIYMYQPEGFVDPDRPEYVCKLQRSIYGLKQSARCWNATLDEYLTSVGYRKSDADSCIYLKSVREGNGHISFVILGVYVDDLVPVSNNSTLLKAEKVALCERFDMVDQGEISYLLGMSIKRDRQSRTLTISQPSYLEKVLKRFGMENSKPVATPIEPGKRFQQMESEEDAFDVEMYRQAIGCLTYASTSTRPDLAAAVGMLAQYMSKPSKEHWAGVKRILRYIRGTLNYGLKFQAHHEAKLIGFSDADWAGDVDTRRSTFGYVFQLGGVSWSSRRQTTVAKSSTEAEYVALSSCTQEAVWLRRLLKNLGKDMTLPTVIYEDNQGAIELAKNSKFHSRTKHIDISHHFVRERVMNKEICVTYCPTEDMVADVMTKGLGKVSFQKLRDLLGVHDTL